MIIVDNSLCNIDFTENTDEKNIYDYAVSLLNICVDYIETDSHALKYFPDDIDMSSKFIFRVEDVTDLLTLLQKDFAYVVLPINMISVSKNFPASKIIIEINAENIKLDELSDDIETIQNSECADIIRIVKDFQDKDCLSQFITDYKAKCGIILDICPLNTSMNGLISAVDAYCADADMMTLSFAAKHTFTPLEMFIAYLDVFFGMPNESSVTPRLFSAASCLSEISEYAFLNCLHNINTILFNDAKPIENIDVENIIEQRPKAKNEKSFFRSKALSQFIKNNDVDPKIGESLSEIIENALPNIFNPEILKDYIKS